MKKTLLIAVATVMVALGANAQVARVASKTMGYAAYQNNFKLENVMVKEYQSPVSKNLTAHRAAPASIEGDYILNADNFDGSFTASTSFSVVAQSGTITLDQYDGNPSFDYNVVLNDFSYAGAVVYGNYNARFLYRPSTHTQPIKKSSFLVVIVKEKRVLAMERKSS